MISLICGIQKMMQMNLFTKQKQTHRIENKLMVTKGERGGVIDWEFGTNMYTLLYLKWVTNRDLLYNTGNSAQYYVTT